MRIQGGQIRKDAKGEGTRGGVIIGHTRSGKAVYASHNEAHNKFTPGEHGEAARMHSRLGHKYFKKAQDLGPDHPDFDKHANKSTYHFNRAMAHSKKAE